MFDDLKADIGRYRSQKGAKAFLYLCFEQSVWAIIVYRFGRWVRQFHIPLISVLFKALSYLMFKAVEMVLNISVPYSAKIGKGLYIGHFGPVILHSEVQAGENLSLGPGVVIGTLGRGVLGAPKIGNNVYVGVGAKVLGPIHIGDNVKIGANAVVIKDIPSDVTVVGIPGKILNKHKQ